jgi:predicted Co/Zn/Cd cation transporter (cation efflux family)
MASLRTAPSAIRDFWIDHLWVDSAVVIVILGAHIMLVILYPVFDVFGHALPGDRRAVYSSTAIVVSLLGSFSGVAIGQLSSAKGSRANALRAQGANLLADNWRSIFHAAILSALLAIVALLLDPSVANTSVVPVVVRWVFEAGLIFAVVKFLRLSALFYEIITVASISSAEPEHETRAAAPTADQNWSKRAAS